MAADEGLKRLGGGRWQTRDERFTIEPQSGTWVVVDADQVDDLGLPLVRGPFGSLGAAKAAIADARTTEPAPSPLSARAARLQAHDRREAPATSARTNGPPKPSSKPKAAQPKEPRWITDLDPGARKRARRLVERLTAAGAPDAEGIARREVVGEVPAAAAFAIRRRILELGPDASPTAVARLLAGDRDDELGVRWHLADGDGRPIVLDVDTLGDPDPSGDAPER